MSDWTGKAVVILEGNDIRVELSAYHLQRFVSGAVSLPFHRDLEHVAFAHAFFKSKGRDEPDKYVRQMFVRDGTAGAPGGVGEHHLDVLDGPSDKLMRGGVRTMVIKQNAVDKSSNPCVAWLSCVYDRAGVVFVDDEGRCLYVHRAHIINATTFPNYHHFTGGDDKALQPPPPPPPPSSGSDGASAPQTGSGPSSGKAKMAPILKRRWRKAVISSDSDSTTDEEPAGEGTCRRPFNFVPRRPNDPTYFPATQCF